MRRSEEEDTGEETERYSDPSNHVGPSVVEQGDAGTSKDLRMKYKSRLSQKSSRTQNICNGGRVDYLTGRTDRPKKKYKRTDREIIFNLSKCAKKNEEIHNEGACRMRRIEDGL